MALPSLTLPPDLPAWRAQGYQAEPEPIFGRVPMSTGASRARRIYTAADRRETCTLRLSPDQLLAFHDWYEDDLQAGLLPFAAQVADLGPGTEWFDALLLDYKSTPLANGKAQVEAHLLLRGSAYQAGPA